MPETVANAPTPPLAFHTERSAHFKEVARGLEASANRVSFARLGVFLAMAACGITAGVEGSVPFAVAAAVLAVGFAVLLFIHARINAARAKAEARAAVHARHLQRLAGTWTTLPSTGEGLVSPEHAYASDLDLVGAGSLFQWLDVSHTKRGALTLVDWLSAPADAVSVRRRQEAVTELAALAEFRQELEASVRTERPGDKLDGDPFLAFTREPSFLQTRNWLVSVMFVLPVITLGAIAAASFDLLPRGLWLGPLLAQFALIFWSGSHAARTFELVASRRGFAEAFADALALMETTDFKSAQLRDLKAKLMVDGRTPSSHMRALDRAAGFAELRTQFPLHLVANTVLLWDLHVLRSLEAWNRSFGAHCDDVFRIVGEVEALSSLATLAALDPAATMPTVADDVQGFEGHGITHPLLPTATRIPNDVRISGPGTALIITGSNMAGKSTLLRAVGVNIVLALAGGPVTATDMRLRPVRLRASMRVSDSLQRGASYFHAELSRLRTVIADAEAQPPVFFLLDELLRGTNAQARHTGAKSVLLHLMKRGAFGIVATHDVALAELEGTLGETIRNQHFTDVIREGEMIFDYRLRDGVVTTSNALHLLALAGVEVPNE